MTEANLNTFLLRISKQITQDTLEELKFGCKFDAREREQIHKPYQLFDALIRKGKLSNDDTNFLQNLLQSVGEKALRDEVEAFTSKSYDSNHNSPNSIHSYGLEKKKYFIGRKQLVNKISDLLQNNQDSKQMVVLVGPPGFGKSAIVTHVGYALYERMNSVIFVSLRQITTMYNVGKKILQCVDPNYPLSDDVVVQTKNYLVSLTQPTVLILDNTEDIQNSSTSGHEFAVFIEYVASKAKQIKILIGSRKDLSILSIDSETIQLNPLDESSSVTLLAYFALIVEDSNEAKELGIQCKGIPLLIKIAGCRVKCGYKASQLAEDLKHKSYEFFNSKGSDPLQDYLTNSVRVFLDSLRREELIFLVHVSNFSTDFTADDVCKAFKHIKISDIDCKNMLSYLRKNALLQLQVGRYSLHPLLQTFCKEDQERMKCVAEGKEGMEAFTYHYLEELESIHQQFVSKEFQKALQRYDSTRMNVKQARENAIKLGTKKLKLRCIDAFNNSINLLGKIMSPSHCLDLYQELYEIADQLDDKKRMSECLISIGFKHLCEVGHNCLSEEAYGFLNRAESLHRKLPKRERQSEAYAHCQSKLGLCIIAKAKTEPKSGCRQEGKKRIENALTIRNQRKDQILVAASYCDKAIADRLSDEHSKAITTLKEHCYPVYKEHLGDDHPWVASILNYISDSYKALEKLDDAVKYNKMSLSTREKTLGRHQDTARSFVHLAKLLDQQGNLEEALYCYREAASMQEEVLGVHEETKASLENIVVILGKLGREEEKKEILQRLDSSGNELEQRKTLRRQISSNIQQRADSKLKREQFKKYALLVTLLVIAIAIMATFLF